MILTPKAKPIRIRIISGGEEHSSLESLRNNFSLKDLIPTVNDGRLAKWLRQKGENELAERILNFSFNSDSSKSDRNNALEFIGIFFPNLKALSVGGVIDFWRKENKKNFQHLKSFKLISKC